MFGYYTALLIITLAIIISALIVIYYDDVLLKINRITFIATYVVLVICNVLEWLVIYLSKTSSPLHLLTTFSTAFVLFLAPSMIAVLAWGIDDKRSKSLTFIVALIVGLNFIIGLLGIFSDTIFYYDEQLKYHRGEYFYVHFMLVMVSVLTLLINTFRLGLKYQNKKNYILVLNFFLFLFGLLTHFSLNGVYILWISVSIATTLLFIYYSAFLNQTDILTGILNRKCYEVQLYDMKCEAILLIIDVNKFKEINDTKGHAVGDYCLIEIANVIKEVYGKSGYCYRIGGDEFSVILYKNLDLLEELNEKFCRKISEQHYKYELPTVSVGHSYYYPNKTSIQKVIEEADSMMYLLKQQSSLSE